MASQPFQFGALYGSFDIAATPLFHNANGQFNALAGMISTTNLRLAIQLQGYIAMALRTSLKRPHVSTGMLEQVLKDDRNRIWLGYRGFGVGIPDFLDDSAAKYWRQIDEGFGDHVGHRMIGLWANTIRFQGPDYISGFHESQRSLVGQVYGFGPPSGQGFRPFGKLELRAALNRLSKQHGRRISGRGVIKVAIEPHEYFRKGWDDFGGPATVQKAYDDVFRSLGIPVIWTRGKASPPGQLSP